MELSNSIVAFGLFLPVLITYICYYCNRKLSYWSRCGVEQLPDPHWLFGHFKKGILFQTSPGWHLGELYRKAQQNAPFVGFYIFHKPCLLLKDAELIKHVLIKDSNSFPDRNFAGNTQKDSIGLRNLFGVRGPQWKYMRHKMAPMMQTKAIKEMLPLMMQTGTQMLQFLDSQTKRQLDVQDVSFKYAADLIACVALGTKTNSFSNPNGKLPLFLSSFFHSFRRMLALVSVFFAPDFVDNTGSLLLFNSKYMRSVFWNAMNERKRSGEKKGDFIDFALILQNEPQNQLYEFSGDNLVHQAGTFMSGFESSATATAFTLMELAKHKHFQDQVRADIRQAVQKYGWTYNAFLEMKFLKQCIYEAMRMHPQVSTLDRIGNEDYQIPGTDITIKKGTAIYISIYGLHHDPKYFKDPGTFDPSRFGDSRVTPEAYLPFGAGPRMCLGTKLGILHSETVISMILANYEIYQDKEEKHVLDSRSTFTAAVNGINIHYRKLTEEEVIQIDQNMNT